MTPNVPICLDGRMLGKQATGVATYTETILVSLRSAGVNVGILDDGGDATRRSRSGKVLAALRPGPRHLVRASGGYHARDLFREAHVHFTIHGRLMVLRAPWPPGIMHWTYPVPLRIEGWRNVYTVHDLIPLDTTLDSPVDPRRLRAVLDRIIDSADRLVTVSEAARADIVAKLGCGEALVTNCSQAIDVAPVAAMDMLPAPLRRDGYHLYVGSGETRKNLNRLVEAHRLSGVPTPLVLAGPHDRLLAGARCDDRVIVLPYQDRSVLLRMIADARALLFPSLAEGFGLPVAEAMALGTPVLTSRGGALEEIAGSAALLVDPHDIGAMAAAISRLDCDDQVRRRLSEMGHNRARKFDQAAYAARLLDLYQDIWTNARR